MRIAVSSAPPTHWHFGEAADRPGPDCDDCRPVEMKPEWVVKCETCGAIADPDTRKIRHKVTDDQPTMEELEEWVMDIAMPRATDGCSPVEPDGMCEHGHLSWMRAMGLI